MEVAVEGRVREELLDLRQEEISAASKYWLAPGCRPHQESRGCDADQVDKEAGALAAALARSKRGRDRSASDEAASKHGPAMKARLATVRELSYEGWISSVSI
jgi:hypothetical protein